MPTYPATYPASYPATSQFTVVGGGGTPAMTTPAPATSATVIDFTGHSIADYFAYNIPPDIYAVAYQMAAGVGGNTDGFLTPGQYASSYASNHPQQAPAAQSVGGANTTVIDFTGHPIADYFSYNIPPDIYSVAWQMTLGVGGTTSGFLTPDQYAASYAANHPELAPASAPTPATTSAGTGLTIAAGLAIAAAVLGGK